MSGFSPPPRTEVAAAALGPQPLPLPGPQAIYAVVHAGPHVHADGFGSWRLDATLYFCKMIQVPLTNPNPNPSPNPSPSPHPTPEPNPNQVALHDTPTCDAVSGVCKMDMQVDR